MGSCSAAEGVSLVLCGDPEDGAVAGERPKREGLYAYIELGYVFRQQKLKQHYKAIILQLQVFLKKRAKNFK